MKLVSSIIAFSGTSFALDTGADVENTAHMGGCLWPEAGKGTYVDDPYAKWLGKENTNAEGSYDLAVEVTRSCPAYCEYDGETYVNCSGFNEEDFSYACGLKIGKNSRTPGNHYVFMRKLAGKDPRGGAVFFKGALLNKFRPVPERKMCPKPEIIINDLAAVCGEKPEIPVKGVERFVDFTVWSDDGLSVVCSENAKPIRKHNYEQLNLVCDRLSIKKDYMWLHKSANGKLRGAGKKWITKKYLCRLNHKYEPEIESSGTSPEGSGADTPDSAEVSL